MWERASSLIRKAGTILLLSALVIRAGSMFGVVDGRSLFELDMELDNSILLITIVTFIILEAGKP